MRVLFCFLWVWLWAVSLSLRAELPAPRLSVPSCFPESERMSVMVWTVPETNVHLDEFVDGQWIEVASANYVLDPPICFSLELKNYRILRARCEWSLDPRFNRDLY